MKDILTIRKKFPQYAEMSDGDFLMTMHRQFYSNVHPRKFLNAIEGAANAHATIQDPELLKYWRTNAVKPMDGEDQAARNKRIFGKLSEGVSTGGTAAEAVRSGFHGLTLGAGDEIVAGATSLATGRGYDAELRRERARLDKGRENAPVTNTIAELSGAIALPLGALKAGGSMLLNSYRTGRVAAAEGAVYGYNTGEGVDDRLGNAVDTAALSGAIGAAAPIVGRGAANVVNARRAKKAANRAAKSAPDADQLKRLAQDAYARADAGAPLPRSQFAAIQGAAERSAKNIGMDADLTPQGATVASRFTDAAADAAPGISFKELDILRQKADIPGASPVNRERAISKIYKDAVDRFVDSAAPTMGKDAKEARDMWRRLQKSNMIQDAMEKGMRAGSGVENGIRNEFRKILNSPKKLRGLKPEEIKAVEDVVNGSFVRNTLRRMGRIGPGTGSQSNMMLGALLSGSAGGGLGAAIAGPAGGAIGAAALPGIGYLAQRATNSMTKGAAEQAKRLVMGGGVQSPPGLIPQSAFENLVRRSARGVEALKGTGIIPLPAQIAE